MEKVKRLTVAQICILGVAAIWAFITILALFFCIYANRRSRRETEETGRLARGHWKEEPDIEVKRVSEPFTRRVAAPPLPSTVLGVSKNGGHGQIGPKGTGTGTGGIRHPGRTYHSAMQKGQVAVPAPSSNTRKGEKEIVGGQAKQVAGGSREGSRRSDQKNGGEGVPKKELKRIPRR